MQYPLMIVALFFAYKPFIFGIESILNDLNHTFLFLGLGISFSTLQDTNKTQNKISKKVWENVRYSKIMLSVFALLTLCFLVLGSLGLITKVNTFLHELALGSFVLGISMMSLLKAASEMAENHQKKHGLSANM
ncbi:MAG: hypothetical protein ACOCXH_13145 [Cyclobacteriaceae bacterium]